MLIIGQSCSYLGRHMLLIGSLDPKSDRKRPTMPSQLATSLEVGIGLSGGT